MIEFSDVSVHRGPLKVIDHLSLTIPKSRVTVILGPSGCGKTTLLNLLLKNLTPTEGTLLGLEEETISTCFQEHRLVPWKTLSANLELVLLNIDSKDDRGRKADRILEDVGLGDFREFYPRDLSGGMRQRAALARAFLYPGTLMLLDEPFKGLDLKRKTGIIDIFTSLRKQDSRTTVLVSHDIPEALLLGDQVVILSDRPARVVEILENPLPRESRNLGCPELLAMEKTIYTALIGQRN